MNWKPGDRALFRAVVTGRDGGKVNGRVVTLVEVKPFGTNLIHRRAWSIEGGGNVAEDCLFPIDDDKASWDDCVWRPKVNDDFELEYITVKPDTDACERIIEEIEHYKWRKANELKDGAFSEVQVE